jgi:aldose 1-epimerase
MRYYVAEESRVVAGRDWAVVVLGADDGPRAEVWPILGCNCVRWRADGRELLYAPDPAELIDRPTRGGIPVLFPFPNRIQSGQFIADGREYQLPLNDSTQKNAIHGFTPRLPWRVTGRGMDEASAWLRAEFQISRDAPASRDLWPADARLALTIRLTERALRYEAVVENPDAKPLPFGLGFHPYFAATPDCRVQTPARARWELVDSLPTGRRLPLDADHDLRQPRPVADLTLDDVYTDLPDTPDAGGLIERGRVEYPDVGGVLLVRTSPAFRELVLFTPPHRKAVCLEPYTCPTDAVHLQEREDVGWRVLPPGGRWEGVVEYGWESH